MPGETKKRKRYYGNVRVALRRLNKLVDRFLAYGQRYGLTTDQHQKRLAMRPALIQALSSATTAATSMLLDEWPLDQAGTE